MLKAMICVDDGPAEDGSMGPINGVPYDIFLSQASGTARTQPKGDEIYMLYTGGTTGMPKGCDVSAG